MPRTSRLPLAEVQLRRGEGYKSRRRGHTFQASQAHPYIPIQIKASRRVFGYRHLLLSFYQTLPLALALLIKKQSTKILTRSYAKV